MTARLRRHPAPARQRQSSFAPSRPIPPPPLPVSSNCSHCDVLLPPPKGQWPWAHPGSQRFCQPFVSGVKWLLSFDVELTAETLNMSVRMPEADGAVLARREAIVKALRTIVPGEGVIDQAREMKPFESDGLTAYRQTPMVVVLPETTKQVSEVLRFCHGEGIKVVPRGAGTSLSGGALPLEDGVLLGMAKFNRIKEIDFANRVAVVEPGVTNLAVSTAVAHAGFYYAPDPSSQIACTIGGNVAENSGGVHCLKYGMTI